MRITANRSTLLALCAKAAAAASRDRNKPILCALLLVARDGKLSVTGTDTGHSLTTTGLVNVEEPGDVAIPVETLLGALKAANADIVTLATTKPGRVALTGRGVAYTLNSLDAADYPPPPSLEGGASFRVDGAALAAALGRMRASIAPPENRYGLGGAYLEGNDGVLRLVATDGNRLAWAECSVTGDLRPSRRSILPGSAVPLLLASAEGVVTVTLAERAAEVATATDVIRLRMLEADFPDYRGVLPTSHKRRVLVDRDALILAIKQVSPMATDGASSVKCSMGDDGLVLDSRSLDRGDARAEVEADVAGEPIVVGFNARYMLDALGACPVGRVRLDLVDALGPIQITAGDVAASWVVMPVRLES